MANLSLYRSLTWKEDPFKDETWRFYYHSLDMVGYLMNAYEKNHNQAYLKKAKWYIQSWMSANPSPISKQVLLGMITVQRIV